MSESNEKDGEGSPNDEFEFYIQFTKPLVLDLRSSEDKAIASAWVQKLEVPPQTEEEKKLRLDYLKLLLFVLQRGRLSGIFKKQPAPGGLQPFPQGFSMADMGNLIIDRDETQSSGGGDNQSMPYTIELSSDLREFVAAQEIPNFGVQMYYAWSSDDAIHKWSLFDEDKFSSYILDKIKQLKDARTDDKTSPKGCSKKPCDLSFTKNFTKSKVKSPEEIEKSQGRSYQTYMGLVGRMGGGFKDCDDDQDKYPRQEQRKAGSSKKNGAPRRCQMEVDEEYDNFLSGLSGHNSTQKRKCKCPYPQHRPDCEALGKGVQPFEERNPRSMSPKSKPETGDCNVWPGQGAGGNKRLNAPTDQCDYGSQFSPVIPNQRNVPSSRSISPIRHDMSATGAPCKDLNPMPICTCPCPRQPPQQNGQMNGLTAPVGPSGMQPGSGARPCGNRMRLQRPVNLMAPPDSASCSGGVREASASSQPRLHCYSPDYQNMCSKPQPAIKINQDSWYGDEECDKKPQGDDRRKQKIENLSKMIAKEAREEDESEDMFCYKGTSSTAANRQNFECPQTFSSQVPPLAQTFSKLRTSSNQGKMRQQQPQGENTCFDFGISTAPTSSNSCYSGGFTQSGTNSMTQGSYTMSSECKRKTKPNTETYVKSAAYPPQNQAQYDERSPCQHMQPNMGASDGMGVCSSSQQGDQWSSFKGRSANRPKIQSESCQPGGFTSSNPNSGRKYDLASVLQGIHSKAEAHREKCSQSGRTQSGEPSSCQRSSHSRSPSPFPNQPSSGIPCQSLAPQNKSPCPSPGKSRPEAIAEGMMPGQCTDSSQNVPIAWGSPSAYWAPPGTRPPMTNDTNDSYRKEGASSPGKGMCNAMANPQSPGAYKSAKNGQGPPPQTCQGPSPSNYQRPSPSNYQRAPPSTYQGFQSSNYQGPSPTTCQGFQPQSSQGFQPSTCQGPPPSTFQGPPPSTCQRPPSSTYQGPPSSTYQGPPASICQGPPPSTCQGPPPPICQRPPPSTCQGPPPSNFQELSPIGCPLEDEDPCDEEDEVSGPESLDECPPGSSTSAEFFENAGCEDIQSVSQQWAAAAPAPAPGPAPGPSSRRSPDTRTKECGQNFQNRKQFMVTSTPIQPPFMANESTIPCPTPTPCNMDFQYEQVYGSFNPGQCQEPNLEVQFFPIYGNSDNDNCQSVGQPQQSCGGFMEMQNDTQGTVSTTTNRRRNMLAAPMPDEQFASSQTQSQFNSCNKSNYG